MLPITTNQCSLTFTLLQTLFGGFIGSFSFFVNMIVIGFFYRKYQEYKKNQAATAQEQSAASGFIHSH